jgi:hypothetical protein
VPTDPPRPPPDLDEIRVRIDRLVAKLLEELRAIDAEHGAKREEVLRRSGLPREFLDEVLGGSYRSSLTVSKVSNNLDTMSSVDSQVPAARGRKFTARHPLPARAKALGKAIHVVAADVSKALERKIPRTTVRSWYAPKGTESARPIPEDAVRFFEGEPWGIPRGAWKNGITPKD